jgi:hypothetical protein
MDDEMIDVGVVQSAMEWHGKTKQWMEKMDHMSKMGMCNVVKLELNSLPLKNTVVY